jgi:tagatose-6-phosphate ketose/aldose isomerase
MPQTTTAATTGTWTEEEIRQQPACWIRSLNNIDNLRASIDSFLTPLLRKNDLRIVLTGAAHPPLSAILRHGSRHTGKTSPPYRQPIWSRTRWTTSALRIRCC